MASKIRVRGILSTTDALPAAPVVLYAEGSRTVVTVGAEDIFYLDSYCVSSESATATDVARMFFSDNGVEDAGSTIYMGDMPASVRTTVATLALPEPMSGMPGETVYAQAGDLEPLRVVVTGWVYVS